MRRLAVVAVVLCVSACARVESQKAGSDSSTTQTGSAGEQSRGPKAGAADTSCHDLPSADDLKKWLREAPSQGGDAGGMFDGKMEWATVVNREGQICATSVATDDPASAWPGSQAIAKAKAYTANAYSTDTMPLSTARLYTMTQPGHSLWGVAGPNAFKPECLESPQDFSKTNGQVCGGEIAFGGGVPLYRGKTRVGALGLSGDTPCADHEIAKRIRHMANLDPEKGEFADDIVYASADGPSEFAHPMCDNTWRNGKKLGDEPKAKGY